MRPLAQLQCLEAHYVTTRLHDDSGSFSAYLPLPLTLKPEMAAQFVFVLQPERVIHLTKNAAFRIIWALWQKYLNEKKTNAKLMMMKTTMTVPNNNFDNDDVDIDNENNEVDDHFDISK